MDRSGKVADFPRARKIPQCGSGKILIFTAQVKDIPPGTEGRQLTYLNALEAHSPSIKIMYGDFLPNNRRARGIEVPIDISTGKKQAMRTWVKGWLNIEGVRMRKWEEKQTDVNLACQMVEDAYTEANLFDACCLVSSDSDFLYTLKAKKRLKQRTLLITPRIESRSPPFVPLDILEQVERKDRILTISKELVRSCQLPDKVGKYYKPPEWNYPPHHIK